jgi:hypothetical protein
LEPVLPAAAAVHPSRHLLLPPSSSVASRTASKRVCIIAWASSSVINFDVNVKWQKEAGEEEDQRLLGLKGQQVKMLLIKERED